MGQLRLMESGIMNDQKNSDKYLSFLGKYL